MIDIDPSSRESVEPLRELRPLLRFDNDPSSKETMKFSKLPE